MAVQEHAEHDTIVQGRDSTIIADDGDDETVSEPL